tara:strand:- start:1564 stop:1791 length:228 start_codon:yes stop_codon:yes gene_type:complete
MKKSVFKHSIIYIIKGYQVLISPFLSPCCRFEPSCSSFAITAINMYGVLLGVRLTIGRVTRCHPWSKKYGYDPVP